MKKIQLAFVIILASIAFNVSAADKYPQRIKLYVKHSNSAYATSNTCFTTTDLFDSKHCGNGAGNKYDKGPKSWYLSTATTFSFKAEYDQSCSTYFTKGANRTPDIQGELTIYTSRTPKCEPEQPILQQSHVVMIVKNTRNNAAIPPFFHYHNNAILL